MKTVIWGLMIPFIGTAGGAACVFFLKNDLKAGVQRALTGLPLSSLRRKEDGPFFLLLSAFGWAFCSFFCWIM